MTRALLFLCVCMLAATPVLGQEDGLTISVSKQFGYNMGSQIQGTFKVRARGPEDVVAVVFSVDGEPLDDVTELPLAASFETGDYAPGWHEIGAVGRTADGRTLASNVLSYQFVSIETANKSVVRIMVPVLALIVGAIVLSAVVPLITGRQRHPVTPEAYTPGEPRTYGMLGGTVCPKCGRPFGIHWWGLNISFVGKYDRCPHCGKWSLVRRVSREALAAAEAVEHAAYVEETPRAPVSGEESLHAQLEDSRYTEL